jgi:hypothetical protein
MCRRWMIDGLGLPRDFSAGKVRYGCNAILRDGWAAERGEASTETPLRSEVTIVTRNLPAETEPQRLPHKFLAENLWGNRMQNIVVLIVSIAAAMFLAWSSTRAWRIKNIVLKWTGAGLAALLATAVSLAGVVMIAGLFKLHARSAPTPDMKVAGTPNRFSAAGLLPTVSVALVIRKTFSSRAASILPMISQFPSARSCLQI